MLKRHFRNKRWQPRRRPYPKSKIFATPLYLFTRFLLLFCSDTHVSLWRWHVARLFCAFVRPRQREQVHANYSEIAADRLFILWRGSDRCDKWREKHLWIRFGRVNGLLIPLMMETVRGKKVTNARRRITNVEKIIIRGGDSPVTAAVVAPITSKGLNSVRWGWKTRGFVFVGVLVWIWDVNFRVLGFSP